MRTWTTALGAALIVALSAGIARADDPKSKALTVLPSTGPSVTISPKDKVGTLALDYQRPGDGLHITTDVSAPLDEATREAAFLKENQLTGGFGFNFHIGYDSTYRALNLTEAEQGLVDNKLCTAVGGDLEGHCTPERIEAWGKLNPANPHWITYQRVTSSERARKALRNMPGSTTAQGEAPYHAIGADLSLSYDNLSVYRKSLTIAPTDVAKYELQGGVSGTLYLDSRLALTLRAGGSVERNPGAKKVERCESVASTDTVTGRTCSDVLYLDKDTPDPVGSGYARFAITYVGLEKLAGQIPGIEFRAALEQLGQKTRLDMRLMVFFSSALGPAAARFGVGVDLSDPLVNDDNGGVSKGQLTFTPLLFVGASPTMLNLW